MPLDFMHANHIGGASGGFEEQRSNNGRLIITGLDGAGRDDVLTLAVNSFALPKAVTAILESGYLNETRKFAGKTTYEDLAVTFKDAVDKDIAGTLARWHRQVKDPVSGKIGLARDYKKTAYMSVFAPDGSTERRYRLEGVWPQSYDPGEIDMNGDELMRISITLVIDKFYAEFAGIQPG